MGTIGRQTEIILIARQSNQDMRGRHVYSVDRHRQREKTTFPTISTIPHDKSYHHTCTYALRVVYSAQQSSYQIIPPIVVCLLAAKYYPGPPKWMLFCCSCCRCVVRVPACYLVVSGLCLAFHVDGITGGGGGGVAEILDKYVICRACGGIGIKKYMYNHMVLEKTCEGMVWYSMIYLAYIISVHYPIPFNVTWNRYYTFFCIEPT